MSEKNLRHYKGETISTFSRLEVTISGLHNMGLKHVSAFEVSYCPLRDKLVLAYQNSNNRSFGIIPLEKV